MGRCVLGLFSRRASRKNKKVYSSVQPLLDIDISVFPSAIIEQMQQQQQREMCVSLQGVVDIPGALVAFALAGKGAGTLALFISLIQYWIMRVKNISSYFIMVLIPSLVCGTEFPNHFRLFIISWFI